MDIIAAAEAMKEGKRVRRAIWGKDQWKSAWRISWAPSKYSERGCPVLVWEGQRRRMAYHFTLHDLLADDWEVVG